MVDEAPRTYSIWGILIGLIVVGVLGLGGVLLYNNPKSATVQVPVSSTTTVTVAPATTAPAAVTVPSGAPAPPGVTKVLSDQGTTTYSFSIPEELATVPIRAVVAPATVTPSADGRALQLNVSCLGSSGQVLAQVAIVETPDSVSVLPVVLGPASAPPCEAGTVVRSVDLPLAAELGARPVIVAPPGTEVPTPTAG